MHLEFILYIALGVLLGNCFILIFQKPLIHIYALIGGFILAVFQLIFNKRKDN